MTIQKILYKLLRHYRINYISKLLDKNSKTLLDIGANDLLLYSKIKDKYVITVADINPRHKLIKKEDVQNLSYRDDSFDIVVCMQVLEHLPDPVKAIEELKRVTKKQLLITIPNEPIFTITRLFLPEKEHLWAISPTVLKHYLSKPSLEGYMLFGRYYYGIWYMDEV